MRPIHRALTLFCLSNPLNAQDSLTVKFYKDLFPLIGCSIIACDSIFLGRISADTADQNSIMNFSGPYGYELSSVSIFNDASPFGGMTGVFSPFNWNTESPPKIICDTPYVAYLSENERVHPRVSTYRLIGFLTDLVKRKRAK